VSCFAAGMGRVGDSMMMRGHAKQPARVASGLTVRQLQAWHSRQQQAANAGGGAWCLGASMPAAAATLAGRQ